MWPENERLSSNGTTEFTPLNSVWATLEQAAFEENLDVVLIQEPLHYLDMMRQIWKRYRIALVGLTPAYAVILYIEILGCSVVGLEGPRVCGIQLLFGGSMQVIISVYIRHSCSDGSDQLLKATVRASEMLPFVFVEMDTNGHSRVWVPATSILDRVAHYVEEMLCEGGMLVLNNQDFPPIF